MKILDRYILKKFLTTFFFLVLILIAVILVIDYTEKSDDFIEHNLDVSYIFLEYYANYIPFMINTLSPISVFIAVVFVTSRLASHTEIVAMLSSGTSFLRLLYPYFLGAAFLAVITFFMVGWVIPNAAKKKVAFEVAYIKGPFYFDQRNIHLKSNDSTYVYMESYNNRTKSGYKFTLEKIKDRKLLEKLTATRVKWDTTQLKWHIKNYKVHSFEGQTEKIWEGSDMDTALNVTPKYFESTFHLNETMTLDELDEFIENRIKTGAGGTESYLNEKHERYAYPFAIIVLTMMGVVVSAKKSRQGSGFQIAIGFMFAFFYIIFVMMSRSLASGGGVPPQLAAWLPNITFSIISVVMYFTVPR